MINLSGEEKIYSNRTRQYFKEVMSDYANGNYRSATVMLYSVVICDLLYKLQELRDAYDDKRAEKILQNIKEKQDPKGSKSRWEREFVEGVYKNTNLLDDLSFAELNHLYDHRNFSAHPALNDNFELISPSRETTIAHINNMLNNIFVKPPIFATNIIDMLTEDLVREKNIYEHNVEALKKYLDKKYFERMPDVMKNKCFRTFWKFCFCLNDDANCKENRTINRHVLEILMYDIPDIYEVIKTDNFFMNIPYDQDIGIHLVIFVSIFPQLYGIFSDEVKLMMDKILETNEQLVYVSWYKSKDKKEHLRKLYKEKHLGKGKITSDVYRFMREKYVAEGQMESFLELCIYEYSCCTSYDMADRVYNTIISPSLDLFTKEQFIRIFEIINSNNQISDRGQAYNSNGEIVRAAQKYLDSTFDYSAFSNMVFDHSILHDTEGLNSVI